MRSLKREGFRHIWVLKTPGEIDSAVITRVRMYNDLRDRTGPFDEIGDVHGCLDELSDLLGLLGYRCDHDAVEPSHRGIAPAGTYRRLPG